MQFEGPCKWNTGRYPSMDSIEVAFKSMSPSQDLGQYSGTPKIASESGSIRNLRKKRISC